MNDFMKTILSAIKTWTERKIKSSTADWNQNDSTADNYVKNRTHWEEEAVATIVPEQTINGFALMEEPLYCVVDAFSMEPVIGKTYTVTWDGTSYDVVAREVEGLICFGNENYALMQSGGDIPFGVLYVPDTGDIGVVTESTEDSHTISITATQAIVHKLDEKFIPDNVPKQMIVTFIITDEGEFVVDKTYEEIRTSYIEGKVVTGVILGETSLPYTLQLSAVNDEEVIFSHFEMVRQPLLPVIDNAYLSDIHVHVDNSVTSKEREVRFLPMTEDPSFRTFLRCDGSWCELPKSYYTLRDHTTGEDYVVYMNNGSLVSELKSGASSDLNEEW